MNFAILAALATALAVPAFAQTPAPQTPPARGAPAASARTVPAITPADREFVRRAAEAFAAELEISTLARERAGTASVRELARRSLADHEAAGEKLVELARARRVPLEFTSELRAEEQRRLTQLQGTDFDRAYLQGELAERRRAIALFEKALQTSRDQQIRAFVNETLARERRQLAYAEVLGAAWQIPGATATKEAPSRPVDRDLATPPEPSIAPRAPSGPPATAARVDSAPLPARGPVSPLGMVPERGVREGYGPRGVYDYSRSALDPYNGYYRGVRE